MTEPTPAPKWETCAVCRYRRAAPDSSICDTCRSQIRTLTPTEPTPAPAPPPDAAVDAEAVLRGLLALAITHPQFQPIAREATDIIRHQQAELAALRAQRDAAVAACKALMETGQAPEWPERAADLWDAAVTQAEAAIRDGGTP